MNDAPAPMVLDDDDLAGVVIARWQRRGSVGANWGDKLNPHLIGLIAGKPVVHVDDVALRRGMAVDLAIGSGLRMARRYNRIWGHGFIGADDRAKERPASVHAVRGPLTRAALAEQGIDAPAVFGDPALLWPLFCRPDVRVQHDWGVIRHFREAEAGLPLPRPPAGETMRAIDIKGGLIAVTEAILSCRRILSSSLHGVIAAHAFGVPATWVRFSGLPIGDGFKFRDYWMSVGRELDVPPIAAAQARCDDLVGIERPGEPLFDARRLIAACPFASPARKARLAALAGADRPGFGPAGWRPR